MSTPVPDWAGPPDADGNRNGPRLASSTARVVPTVAWMADDKPMLWMDTARYGDGPLTAREAIEIATGLTQGALLAGGVL